MKILVACDSFKESLSSTHACKLIASAWQQNRPQDVVEICPVADGGEGTTSVIIAITQGRIANVATTDPLGRPIVADIGWVDPKTAIIEIAGASGLQLLSSDERNPLVTSTFGTGLLIRHAIEQGAKKIVLGLGGSATNDVGVGLLQALGAVIKDHNDCPVKPGGGSIKQIASMDLSALLTLIQDVTFDIACDVTNPLTGQKGASHVFARQKGATDHQILQLEESVVRFNQFYKTKFSVDLNDFVGGGAAGGVGAVSQAILKGTFFSGINMVMRIGDIEQKIANADLVITGEGKFDAQSLSGKAPIGIAKLCKKLQTPVFVICGINRLTDQQVAETDVDAVYSVRDFSESNEHSLKAPEAGIIQAVRMLISDIKNV